MHDNYSLLIEKLDGFIRKFYINQLLRGALYTVGAVLGLFILLNVAEYYFYFNTGVRTAMFWGFAALSGVALYRWVALPLMHYFHLGKVISHEQAAQIIGDHFANVKDKLLNILQLKQQSSNAIYADLITASINQKSDEIKFVPFKAAIDLGKNRKHLRWALPPIMLLLFLLLGAPNIIREGTMRLWNSSTKFEKPAPFQFVVNADSLRTVQFADYVLKVKAEGAVLPNEMFINLGNVQYRLEKNAANEFSYTFVNVQKDTEFKLFAAGLESDDYTLGVVKKPNILSFSTKLDFPEYVGRPDESLSNVGDLVIPQGTSIGWVFNVQNTDMLALRFGNDGGNEAKRFDDELFQFNRRALRDETYKIFISNNLLPNADSVAYTITVIPDLHPQIAVEEFKDSTNQKMLFFAGDASDDYGLLNLTFNYQIKKTKGGQLPMNSTKIEKKVGKTADYNYTWDIRDLDLQPGDEVSYYFEVFDNDAVNGSKSARTGVMQYKMPTLDEFHQQQADNSEEIKKDLDEAIKESKKNQEELKKLRDKVLQKKEMDWQTRKEMEKLLDRQKKLQQKMEQAKQNFEQNNEQKQEFQQEQSEQMQQKQEQMEKMFQEAVSEEMKQLMEDIQKLLQEMNKDQMLEKMEEMQMSAEEMQKEMERLEELYKQLEVEQMLDQQIQELEELAKKEEEAAKNSEEEKKSDEELQKEQEDINKKLEELMKKEEEIKEKNEDLKRPQELEDSKKDMEDTKKDTDGAKQDLDKKQKKGASKKQKSAANKMKNMANKKKEKKAGGDKEQAEEDIKTIRQLLENLVGLSFAQEQTMKEVEKTTINTPRYVELGQQQFKIKDDFRLVEDSLQALASRNFNIESVINEKVTDIKASMKRSLDELEDRQVNIANEEQQRTMKNLNDLALMLAESMEQMQQQMADGMPGDQACQKPGKGKGKGKGKSKGDGEPKDKMSKGQEDVGKMMKEMKERMEKGKNSGGAQGGAPGSSKEFSQLAAKQAALRNAMRQKQKELQEQGKGDPALDQLQDEMNKVEIDLVNKRLTNEMMKRQEQIMTRLLEHEKAEREREQDDQRQAQAAQQQPAKMPPALEEYLKKRRAEVDQFRTVSPALKPFYKRMVEDYLKGAQ